jgi:uncharacterized protein (DUF1015 family)
MADVRGLLGVRYNPQLTDELGALIAPPYDVTLADRLAAALDRAPFNIGHLENVVLDAATDPHRLAADRYRAWRRDGVLVRDPAASLYLHRQTFTADGQTVSRRGVLARVRLARWDEQSVLPHERTFPGPRQERLARLRAVGANLSPLYLLYRDPAGELCAMLDKIERDHPPLFRQTDVIGAEHSLAVATDPRLLAQVGAFFAPRRLYVADGHHRYEAALAYRDERRAAGDTDPEAQANFVLALLADVADRGVRVLPTHRLITGLPGLDSVATRAKLAELFDLRRLDEPADLDAARSEHAIARVAFPNDSAVWLLSAKPGRPHEALMSTARGDEWRQLDVAIVEDVVLAHVLGVAPDRLPAHVRFTHDEPSALTAVASGDAQLALLLRPLSLPMLTAVADAGDTLPAKSTYFDPKVPAGLVINELSGASQ